MIPNFILKKAIIPIIEKIFYKMFDQQALAWKFRENNDYRELPNELDRGMEKIKVETEMVKGQLKDLVNDINKLKNIASKAKNIRSL